MSDPLTERLNQILPNITSDDFLRGKGLGNEIAFYIFDYPPEAERRIREHIVLAGSHAQQRPGLVASTSILDFVIEHLRHRKLLDKAMEMQKRNDAFVLKQLSTLLHPNKIAPAFAEVAQHDQHDLVLVSGVGSVYLCCEFTRCSIISMRSWATHRWCCSIPVGTTVRRCGCLAS